MRSHAVRTTAVTPSAAACAAHVYSSAMTSTAPMAPTTGSIACCIDERAPSRISYLISRPTIRKKSAIRPSLTTCCGVVEPNGRCHCAWYCGAHDEFAHLNASSVQPNRNTPLLAWPAGSGEVKISPAFLDNMLSGTRGPAQNAPVMKISAIDGSRHGSCSMTESALNR